MKIFEDKILQNLSEFLVLRISNLEIKNLEKIKASLFSKQRECQGSILNTHKKRVSKFPGISAEKFDFRRENLEMKISRKSSFTFLDKGSGKKAQTHQAL